MKTETKDLILWGSHPAYCGGVPIKIASNPRQSEVEWRQGQGWKLALYREGEEPKGFWESVRKMARAKKAQAGIKAEQFRCYQNYDQAAQWEETERQLADLLAKLP